MEVLSSGVLKVLPQYPQRVLTLDGGGIQQCTPNHYIRSSNTVPVWSRNCILMNVMQSLHWPFSSPLQWWSISYIFLLLNFWKRVP